MSLAIKVAALVVAVGAALAEGMRLVAAPGLALVGGLSLAGYLWFLAATRRRPSAPLQRRRL
ncbi:MAG TPA: hypothetical protein VLW17_13785 [Thermoanaerobaculaceae bacterium]|nr:hypothetical protein [Thermoanaerobaculaceae bacterium]